MVPDWEFDKIYALSGGFTFDSGSGLIGLKRLIEKALGAEIGSGAPGSMGVTSPGVGEAGRGRGFWFRVGTELIVYGATEPDARVTVQGRPDRAEAGRDIQPALRASRRVTGHSGDGRSADGAEEITVTSTVEKSTDRED